MIEVKTVTGYQTSDGKTFFMLPQARRHEAGLLLRQILEAGGVGSGGEWSREMIADWIESNRQTLMGVLQEMDTTEGGEITCPDCHGTGELPGPDPGYKGRLEGALKSHKCDRCKGTGRIRA